MLSKKGFKARRGIGRFSEFQSAQNLRCILVGGRDDKDHGRAVACYAKSSTGDIKVILREVIALSRNSRYKRNLLYRRAKGNVQSSAYAGKLFALLGQSPNPERFMSLESTDYIIDLIKKKRITSKTKVNVRDCYSLLGFINDRINGDFYLLVDREWFFVKHI